MTEPIYKSAAGEAAVMDLYERTLAHWPVPCTTAVLPTRHGDTFVIASGPESAPPVVLLHGASSNALAWIGDVATLSHTLRVYAVDLPGEPGRSSPNRPPWAGPAFSEWMEDVLDGLHIEQAALVGISQGGWTALKFATAQPERVAALVLLRLPASPQRGPPSCCAPSRSRCWAAAGESPSTASSLASNRSTRTPWPSWT